MSRHPDPCYCEQAQAYEDLLNRVLDYVQTGKSRYLKTSTLIGEIEKTIGEYQTAQEEYVDE